MNLICRAFGHRIVRIPFEGSTPPLGNGDSISFRSGTITEDEDGQQRSAPITEGVVIRRDCGRCGKPWDRRATPGKCSNSIAQLALL